MLGSANPMAACDPILLRELPLIRKIIEDEAWLESERRGCPVAPDDPVVRDNVCLVVLRVGASVREALAVELASEQRESPPGIRTHAA